MKKNLGRGLAYLMGNIGTASIEGSPSVTYSTMEQIHYLPIDQIKANPNQPRKYFDEQTLQELTKSIERSGIISPILVTKINDSDEYEIIAGERRFRAAQYANMTTIPAIIKNIAENTAFELAIIENIQRQNLNVVEEAKSYRDLINKYSYSQNEVALIVGKSRSHITNILRLLNLPDSILNMLIEEKISMGHARSLIGSENAEKVAQKIVEQNLSVREVERIIKNQPGIQTQNNQKPIKTAINDGLQEDLKLIEQLLEQRLRTQVQIKLNAQNHGTISINYTSLEQLDQILQLLGKNV